MNAQNPAASRQTEREEERERTEEKWCLPEARHYSLRCQSSRWSTTTRPDETLMFNGHHSIIQSLIQSSLCLVDSTCDRARSSTQNYPALRKRREVQDTESQKIQGGHRAGSVSNPQIGSTSHTTASKYGSHPEWWLDGMRRAGLHGCHVLESWSCRQIRPWSLRSLADSLR